MPKEKLKVFILTHGGSERLLELLSESDLVEVVGVYVEKARQPNRTFKQKLERSIKYDGYLETLKKFSAKFFGGKTEGAEELKVVQDKQKNLDKSAENLGIPIFHVENYHSEETRNKLKNLDADLGVLYGTNIIKKSVFEIPGMGSINIHQGLAPIYRGGPTVFWELYNGEKKIGITVHFVAPKVDTGDLILQKTLPLEYDFEKYGLDFENFLSDFRATLKEPSSQMMAEAIKQIAQGKEQRANQDISIGKRYRLPTKREKEELVKILKTRFQGKKQKVKGKNFTDESRIT
ncbi:MAG: formyltransferase family protein [Aridibacter sp.]